MSTRPRQAGDGLTFRERNGPSYSVEWSDAQGYFFLLEPPVPLSRQPSMDEIRNARAPIPVPSQAPPSIPAPGDYSVEVEAARDREKASPRDIAEGSERIIAYFDKLDREAAGK